MESDFYYVVNRKTGEVVDEGVLIEENSTFYVICSEFLLPTGLKETRKYYPKEFFDLVKEVM